MRCLPAPRRCIGLLLGSLVAWLSVVTAWSPCADPEMAGHGVASMAASETRSAAAASATDEHAAHAHHTALTRLADAPGDLPLPHHAPTPAQGTACPMALACTPVGLMGDEVALLTVATSLVEQRLAVLSDRTPDSTRRAPEPPPPRA